MRDVLRGAAVLALAGLAVAAAPAAQAKILPRQFTVLSNNSAIPDVGQFDPEVQTGPTQTFRQFYKGGLSYSLSDGPTFVNPFDFGNGGLLNKSSLQKQELNTVTTLFREPDGGQHSVRITVAYETCSKTIGGGQSCNPSVQTESTGVRATVQPTPYHYDPRGLVYVADRTVTGGHFLGQVAMNNTGTLVGGGTTYQERIDWGDGVVITVDRQQYPNNPVEHFYAAPGVYRVVDEIDYVTPDGRQAAVGAAAVYTVN